MATCSRPFVPTWPHATLLGSLTHENRSDILQLGTRVCFRDGETLLREGERSRHVYLLLKGWFRVLAASNGGQEVLLAIRAGGDLVGELAGFDGQPRVATVKAASQALAQRIGHEQFQRFLSDHDDAARQVFRSVGEKLRWATRRRYEFATCPLDVRLTRVLIELARVYGQPTADGLDIAPPLTQTDLAALVGASEPATHRALTNLRKSRLIDTGYRRIRVLRPQALMTLAGLDPVLDLDAETCTPLPGTDPGTDPGTGGRRCP